MKYAPSILLLLLAATTAPTTPEFLIQQLASPDPKTRADAADELLGQGVMARPAVLAATQSPSPEVRSRAAELILKLPWSLPSDPGEVQRVLNQYGQHDPGTRIHDVYLLSRFSDHAGLPALVRLLPEDPADPVRWAIVSTLHALPVLPPDLLTPLQKLDPADQPASILTGMALAFRHDDVAKSRDLYQRAADALARDAAPAELHLAFGQLLTEHGLRALARHELEAALAAPGPHDPTQDASAHFELASIIGDADDRAAADHIKAGIDTLVATGTGDEITVEQGGIQTSGSGAIANARAQMYLHYYRDAVAAKKTTLAQQHLDHLLALNFSRADVVLEVVPALKSLGRNAEAQTVFNRGYQPLKSLVDADPKNAEALNNLAWLCARCGERPDEAVQLADAALQLSPDNPAYLDTSAEALFRAGRRADAVARETQALQLRPGEEFMQTQLQRFQQSPTTTTTNPTP